MRQATTLFYALALGVLFLFGQHLSAQSNTMIFSFGVPLIGNVPIFEISETHQSSLDGINDTPFDENNIGNLDGIQIPYIGQVENINPNAYTQAQVQNPLTSEQAIGQDQVETGGHQQPATDKAIYPIQEQSPLQIRVAPNPASDFLKISTPEPISGELVIYNILGQKVHSATIAYSQSTLLNVSHLASGNYILQARDDAGEVVTQRIQIHQ